MRTQPLDVREPLAGPEPREFELLLSDIASDFIGLPLSRFDEMVVDALRRVVLALDLDRSTISETDVPVAELRVVHSWARPGGATPLPQGRSSLRFPWAEVRLRQGLPVVFSRLDDLPADAAIDAANYASIGLRAHVAMPIRVGDTLVSVHSFGMVRSEREWSAPMLGRMRLIANIFGSLYARKIAQERIDEQRCFDALLVDISTSLAAAAGERADTEIQRATETVGAFLQADRLELYRADPASRRLGKLHAWQAPTVPGQPSHAMLEGQSIDGVLDGRTVRTGSADHPRLAGSIALPLMDRGAVRGAVWLARDGEGRAWSDDLVPRLEVFGNMVVGAMARRDAEEEARRATLEAAEHRERLAHLARVDAVGAMSAAIAHEVNQPLAAIRNYALAGQRRLAGEGPADRARLTALLEKIADQAGAASDVLDRLRAIVRRRDPVEVRIDAAALLDNARRLIEIDARRDGVAVRVCCEPRLPAVLGDDVQLQQVIMNLAHNAVEALAAVPPNQRRLTLSAGTMAGERLLIEVADTGPGVTPEAAERIFDPFYTTRAAGLGIGLAISRAIVEAHGGELWHAPRAGGGSSFRFTLPAAKQAPAS
jgi:signal transduction histidine kinase